ncbi:MAG: GAF domain-containing protein [Proteobacteria bacterium]|nr:GAF domain-containing protein [Pseudomonadota bacterium]
MTADPHGKSLRRQAGAPESADPRRLMSGLRDIMLSTVPAGRKLEEIVRLVAGELQADVCSCFVQRAGELLELFATVGLDAGLVHRTRVRVGDGLVGDIAEHAIPLALPDAASHPAFISCPESGGSAFKSFCGVPVLHGGVVRGVLVVQHRLPKSYDVDVVETLQTVAMVLAEVITFGGIVTIEEASAGLPSSDKPTDIEGMSLGRGLAIGHAVLYEPRLTMLNIVADDPKAQKLRLRQAVAGMQEAINRMLHKDVTLTGTETRDILEAYQMFARDKGWFVRIEAAIDKGLSAEAAVQSVLNETRARMAQMNDDYIRERLQDIEDLSNRLLGHLMRQSQTSSPEMLPDDIILVARSMGPAALLDYDRHRLKGVVLEKGSQGVIYLRPSQYVLDLYSRSMEARARRTNMYRRLQHQPSVTRDNIKISVQINAGLLSEVSAVQNMSVDGIGLFRTELAFMGWKKYPPVVTQAEFYGKIIDQMEGEPVVFRTLDIGGDKPLPYFKAPEEDNPALGWRAVRIGIDRPAVLRTQFRAFIRGSRGRNLKIMLPLVTEVAELDRARQLLEMEKIRARHNNIPVPEKIELGVMLEVPALLWQMDALLWGADFISVGTNDLMQYLYAADRGNNAIRNRYDQLSPAMLRVLKMVADQCKSAGVPVSICGEMAGQPLEAMVLIALGYTTLSVSAQSVEAIKMMIPTIDAGQLLPYLEQLMQSREHSLREQLLSFARDHHVHLM